MSNAEGNGVIYTMLISKNNSVSAFESSKFGCCDKISLSRGRLSFSRYTPRFQRSTSLSLIYDNMVLSLVEATTVEPDSCVSD